MSQCDTSEGLVDRLYQFIVSFVKTDCDPGNRLRTAVTAVRVEEPIIVVRCTNRAGIVSPPIRIRSDRTYLYAAVRW